MSLAEIARLSLREKFQIMEAIWEDLREASEGFDVPQSHRDLLDSRRERVRSGAATLLDWDAVKHSIGRR